MAEQDFNINIRTLADLTGIKLTQVQLEALQKASVEGNQKAANALKQLAGAQKQAQSNLTTGFTGSALGIGTIISLVTGAITKWKAFNDEQDRMVEGMIRAEEKVRALGESIIAMQDAARSAARVDNEPLIQSYVRLQQEVIRLKTEQSLLNLPEQGEEWKKLNSEIRVNESLLDKVTSKLKQQTDAKEKAEAKKAAEKKEFEVSAFEAAARDAKAAGDVAGETKAQQTVESLRRGTPLEEIRRQQEGIVGRRAEAGESQQAVNQLEQNRLDFEKMVRAMEELRDQWK